MNINDRQQDLIDQFLQGVLVGVERDHFLAEVEKDAHLKKELQTQQEMMEGIEFHGNKNLRRRLSKISKEVKQEHKSKPGSNGSIIRFLLSAAAAIALLLIAFNLFFKSPNTNKLITQFYQPFEISNIRSSNLPSNTASAFEFYNQKNYNLAIPQLTSILESQPEHSQVQLALGNALMNTDQNESAILQFQNIIDKKDKLYSDQAKWYLALTYLKSEDSKTSKTLLKELALDPNADFHKEATELLDLLGN